ncbi:hypothetical protein WCLP8_3470003 [uncultured Gammaproteobacteria bacterium]
MSLVFRAAAKNRRGTNPGRWFVYRVVRIGDDRYNVSATGCLSSTAPMAVGASRALNLAWVILSAGGCAVTPRG